VTESSAVRYYDRDFWSEENQKYRPPHYRLEKSAHLVNKLAGWRDCDLLDVGCGPATLRDFLRPNIHYHGIDIALPRREPNLLEIDLVKEPIRFRDQKFDIIIAQGLFEYLGEHQDRKLSEIARLLMPNGRFVTSYVNFSHHSRYVYGVYNNVQPLGQFRRSLEDNFTVERCFPTSHNWRHDEPSRPLVKLANMYLNVNLPYITPKLAVEYFFVCRPRA
jgi:SAM-dependent methyltransferase